MTHKMKRLLLYILVPCLLTSLGTPVFSEKPLRLFFEKDSALRPEKTAPYTVQDGDSLFTILKKQGFSETQIQNLLPVIQQANPLMESVDKIHPGQMLLLPLGQHQETRPQLVPSKTKDTLPDSSSHVPYIVRSGDTVINIFEQYGISRPLIFSQYLPLFRKLNPRIANLDHLRQGQEVLLPLPQAQAGSAKAAPRPSPDILESEPKKPILQAEVASQKPSRFGSLPGTANATANGLATEHPPGRGQSTQAPFFRIQNKPPTPRSPSSTPAMVPTDQNNHPPEPVQPGTSLPYLREILKAMHCTFARGDIELHPLPQGGWFQIKLQETPVVTMPWGKKTILCPTPKNSAWVKQAAQLGMLVCPVPADWSLDGVLRSLAETFPKQIRLWPPEQDISLSSNALGLTVKTPCTVVMQHQGKKIIYALWHRPGPDDPPLPQGLAEVLADAQVKIIETNYLNEIDRLPSRPKHSIYMPRAERTELIRILNPDSPQELFGSTLPENLDALLRLLKSRDMLHPGVASLNWSGHQGRRINIQVPAWFVGTPSSKIILLDTRFADEYLVSLLAQEGYSCFVLPD